MIGRRAGSTPTLSPFESIAGALIVTSLVASACSDASTGVAGGEPRFDAAAPKFTANVSPTSWKAIYTDMLGPGGTGSCVAQSACHGSKDQLGARGSGGFVCSDKDTCLVSLKSPETGLLAPEDKDAPEKSGFYGVLRRVEDGRTVGIMPKAPAYVFSNDELARIKTWIANGAPND